MDPVTACSSPLRWGILLLQSDAESGIRALTELSAVSVLIALLALTLIGAIGFGVFLFSFVRIVARR